MLGVQSNHRLARFQQIADQQLDEIALALTAVAQNEDIGRGLIAVPTVKVHHDVAAVLVFPNVKAVGICLAGVIERIEIGHAAGGQYPLELPAQHITAHRADAAESLLLPQEQLVHIQLAAHQLRQYIRLELTKLFLAVRRHFQIHGTVDQRLVLPVHFMHQLRHIPQVALRRHRLPQLVGVRAIQLVFLVGVVDDPVLLAGGHLPAVNAQRHAAFFAQLPQERLGLGAGRIFPQRPHAAAGAAEDVMVHLEFHNPRCDAIQISAEECFLLGRVLFRKWILHFSSSPHI